MVLSDKRVLWHPRKHNKFVVGGNSQITLYEWAAEYPEIRHVTSQHDLHHMKCFAWSPDPAFDDLLAVGLSTGRVDLIRVEASKQARQPNMLSSGPTVSLPVRTSRSCNALAFCQKDPNYLAVGLDKIRNDSSLVIWDISSTRPALAIASLGAGLDHASIAYPLPSRPQPQIPRMDNRVDSKILQQHALTEIVSSVAFLPDSTHLLLAGVSHRWLRMFDLRSATPAVTNVASKVQEIVTDPFDAHRVACFGDNTVTIWDQRKFGQPLLQFSEKDAAADGARIRSNAAYVHIEFSNVRRNCIATLERDSSYVRFWDIAETRSWFAEGSAYGGLLDNDGKLLRERSSRRSWAATLPWQSQPANSTTPSTPPVERTAYVLADTRRTKAFHRALSSFTVVPNPGDKHPLTSKVMVVNKDGDLEMYQVHDTPKQTLWSSRGEFGLGSGKGFKFISGYRDDEQNEDPEAEVRQPPLAPYSRYERSSRSRSGARRDDSSRRERPSKDSESGVPAGSALFARDEDSAPPSGVAAQLAKNIGEANIRRAYSPASFRKYQKEAGPGGDAAPPLKDFLVSERNDSRSRERTLSPAQAKGNDELLLTARPTHSRERNPSPGPGKKKSAGGRHSKPRGINHVVEEDISMVMRKRALKGYGLSRPLDNANITQGEHDATRSHGHVLSEVWAWIHHSRDVLCAPTPNIHGFDFAFQGLLGLFEGFAPTTLSDSLSVDDTPIATQRTLLDVPGMPSLFERQSSRRSHSPVDDLHGNWNAALTMLMERRGTDKSNWKPSSPTTKLIQRQLGLELCGWSLREEEMKAAVKRWEKEGKISRAACWLVFTKQFSKAMDLLMRSEDEMHRVMSGSIAALAPHSSSALKNPELREHYTRLSLRLQDPYFRMMIIHMGVGDWQEVLEEDVIPFRERLAIAFQFLDDKGLKSFLQRIANAAILNGNIDAIIVTGLTKQGLDVLQSYLDHTGDVQTVAILASYVCPVKFRDRRAEHWLNAYRELLDGFRLHHERVGFDIERGQLLLDATQNGETTVTVANELVPPQILIRCHYCNKPVNTTEIMAMPHKARPTTCPNCSRSLPKCSVCLMTLAIIDDASRELDLGYGSHKDTLEDAIVICQTCRHGGHASHILEWFLGEDGRLAHGMCPVAGCECRCADEL